jgi:hypothetical protein
MKRLWQRMVAAAIVGIIAAVFAAKAHSTAFSECWCRLEDPDCELGFSDCDGVPTAYCSLSLTDSCDSGDDSDYPGPALWTSTNGECEKRGGPGGRYECVGGTQGSVAPCPDC